MFLRLAICLSSAGYRADGMPSLVRLSSEETTQPRPRTKSGRWAPRAGFVCLRAGRHRNRVGPSTAAPRTTQLLCDGVCDTHSPVVVPPVHVRFTRAPRRRRGAAGFAPRYGQSPTPVDMNGRPRTAVRFCVQRFGWFATLCNSPEVSHTAALVIGPRAEGSKIGRAHV